MRAPSRSCARPSREWPDTSGRAARSWFRPDQFFAGRVASRYIDQRNFHVCRMNVSEVAGELSIMDMHFLIGTPDGVDHFVERHELGLWTQAQMTDAFTAVGMTVEAFDDGLMGRGLYVARQPGGDDASRP